MLVVARHGKGLMSFAKRSGRDCYTGAGLRDGKRGTDEAPNLVTPGNVYQAVDRAACLWRDHHEPWACHGFSLDLPQL